LSFVITYFLLLIFQYILKKIKHEKNQENKK
jgi:hypothetical protein